MGKSGSIYFEYFYVVNKMSKTLVLLAGNGVKEYGLVFVHLILNHSKHTIVICDKDPIGNEYIFSSGSVSGRDVF